MREKELELQGTEQQTLDRKQGRGSDKDKKNKSKGHYRIRNGLKPTTAVKQGSLAAGNRLFLTLAERTASQGLPGALTQEQALQLTKVQPHGFWDAFLPRDGKDFPRADDDGEVLRSGLSPLSPPPAALRAPQAWGWECWPVPERRRQAADPERRALGRARLRWSALCLGLRVRFPPLHPSGAGLGGAGVEKPRGAQPGAGRPQASQLLRRRWETQAAQEGSGIARPRGRRSGSWAGTGGPRRPLAWAGPAALGLMSAPPRPC